ncbi:hypothetical protein SAZ11_26970 [Streptomyces sp. FXJ1.4098]|uniref:hypothetical protein n=1 Tax=Streptomyces sp. NPDC020845 TaxID=3365096 RepID=UPI002991A051|nr:hypothetical protein [Streptomyces sp. FXJ1.4098]
MTRVAVGCPLIGLYMRLRLEETPAFRLEAERAAEAVGAGRGPGGGRGMCGSGCATRGRRSSTTTTATTVVGGELRRFVRHVRGRGVQAHDGSTA